MIYQKYQIRNLNYIVILKKVVRVRTSIVKYYLILLRLQVKQFQIYLHKKNELYINFEL